jgi:hypothetical protein
MDGTGSPAMPGYQGWPTNAYGAPLPNGQAVVGGGMPSGTTPSLPAYGAAPNGYGMPGMTNGHVGGGVGGYPQPATTPDMAQFAHSPFTPTFPAALQQQQQQNLHQPMQSPVQQHSMSPQQQHAFAQQQQQAQMQGFAGQYPQQQQQQQQQQPRPQAPNYAQTPNPNNYLGGMAGMAHMNGNGGGSAYGMQGGMGVWADPQMQMQMYMMMMQQMNPGMAAGAAAAVGAGTGAGAGVGAGPAGVPPLVSAPTVHATPEDDKELARRLARAKEHGRTIKQVLEDFAEVRAWFTNGALCAPLIIHAYTVETGPRAVLEGLLPHSPPPPRRDGRQAPAALSSVARRSLPRAVPARAARAQARQEARARALE